MAGFEGLMVLGFTAWLIWRSVRYWQAWRIDVAHARALLWLGFAWALVLAYLHKQLLAFA